MSKKDSLNTIDIIDKGKEITKSSLKIMDKVKFPTEKIIFSKKFRNKYQLDFMRALLEKDYYTVEEAEKILFDYFKF